MRCSTPPTTAHHMNRCLRASACLMMDALASVKESKWMLCDVVTHHRSIVFLIFHNLQSCDVVTLSTAISFPSFSTSYIPPSAGFPGGLLLRLANGTGKGSFPESIGFAQCNLTGSPHLICPHQSSLHSGFNLSQKDARAPQQIHTRFHSSADAC